ncbi:ArsR/SmtB family transcription factor [Plantactinospora soyae]|uniref:DNA-binding transcriptional ArsR family regulator n=1 Tax=Plantactinospora soyae TaxID=1544732 RepID=A0A927R8Z6_9ACTN|nr:helix-turn-helix domain-containing protein [Plantactinospora soyae]MBE1490904.1 DNA-binding transcriptional ArsR family regulator [Plantactinospora soyae]
MISYQLGVDDLADMRFGYSPLLEATTSLWALRWPERHVLHLPWIRRHRDLLATDSPLAALVGPERGWLPDFIAPRPTTPLPDIADELHRVRATEPTKALADLRSVYGQHPLPEVLARRPAALPDAVADALTDYWRVAIEPYWPRMRAVLEADMLHRGQLLAREGAATLLLSLDRRAHFSGGVLRLYAGASLEYDVPVAKRGLLLIPTLFAPQTISPVGPDEPPVVAYPARGIGTLWESVSPAGPGALVDLIGRPRARLLAALDGPASTTDLARRLRVTPSAVSQHLAVLRATGLVSRARAGRVVLYARTELADRLIDKSH